ncbi:RmlC-like cupin domain-containing protein [Amylostereum chailletii]|nr:RmlC-like cupin domain-containing protein [Amylostereum chailletii]
MFSFTTFASLFAIAATTVRGAAIAPRSDNIADLVGQLRLAPTEVDRLRLLSDEDLIFDFNARQAGDVGVTTGAAGHTVEGNSGNFPAVIGQGVSMTIGYLGPCGLNTPHTHPRATEINFSVNTTLQAGFLEENGAAFRTVDIPAGSAAVFPQGAIHFEFNPTCEDAMFVAAFNNENAGVQSIGQRYFGLPPDIVGASLGGLGVVEIQGLNDAIPDNIAYGLDECLSRCGLSRDGQPTAELQPRVTGNAFPNTTQTATSASPSPSMGAGSD